jgi:hypothetical protein
MARIRSIKPEFFRHYELWEAERDSGLPLRVAFIGLWCVADRAGRFKWRPAQLKIEALPYDEVDFSRVLDALTTRGFLVKYTVDGVDYGVIPSFAKHQVINNKEKASDLPEVPDINKLSTRASRVDDASITRDERVVSGREGKGREWKGKEREGEETREGARPPLTVVQIPDAVVETKAGAKALDRAAAKPRLYAPAPITDGWQPDAEDRAWQRSAKPDLTEREVKTETDRFINWNISKQNTSAAWGREWRNWISRSRTIGTAPVPNGTPPRIIHSVHAPPRQRPVEEWDQICEHYKKHNHWMPREGNPPGTPECPCPRDILERHGLLPQKFEASA